MKDQLKTLFLNIKTQIINNLHNLEAALKNEQKIKMKVVWKIQKTKQRIRFHQR